jgi:hypothetical protein
MERIYAVEVEYEDALTSVVQRVEVSTQGDRFWVEMNFEGKRWTWGRTEEAVEEA